MFLRTTQLNQCQSKRFSKFLNQNFSRWRYQLRHGNWAQGFLESEWMIGFWIFNNQLSSFSFNIYSSEPAYFTKKDNNIRLIGEHKYELVDQKAHNRLIKRKKGAKLKAKDKIFLLKIMVAYCKEYDQIRNIYHLSSSTFHRLAKMMKSNFEGYQYLDALQRKENLFDNAIWSVLEDIVSPPQFPLTVKRISEEFSKATDLKLSNYKLRKFLKMKMSYSYQKGSNRPPRVATRSHQLAKGCFACRMLRLLLEGNMIFNCDESSFDRSIRENYSWLPTGVGGSIIGDPVGGKSNLILSVLPNGAWIAVIQNGNIDSKSFSFYLAVLSRVMLNSKWFETNALKILIDNAAIHHSEFTKRAIRDLNIDAIYLPSYSPEMAPVELWFKAVKSVIRKRYTFDRLDFSKETGKRAIIESISSVSREYMQRWWLDVVHKLKEWIQSTLIIRNKLERRERDQWG